MQKKIKQADGFTLIEVLVSIIILSIFALMLVQGIRMTLNAFDINKTKTQALAIANEEIEKIKSLPFNKIEFSEDSPDGVLQKQKLTEDGFLISCDVRFVNGDNRIKQVAVSIIKEPMKKKLEIITEIASQLPGDNQPELNKTSRQNFLPPYNLRVVSDNDDGTNRVVVLEWEDPPILDYAINTYKIYRKPSLIGTSTVRSYADRPLNNREYYYYVTIVYSDGTESVASNEVSAK